MHGFNPNLSSQKVMILMTDGEDHETDPLVAAQEVADQDVLIYTIGFGTPEGDPVPVIDDRGEIVAYKQDQQGNTILSKLDESTLQSIATIGNGSYYRAGSDGQELDNLLAEINHLQRAQLQSRIETRYIERFQIFLFLALLALILIELIPDRRYLHPVNPIAKKIFPQIFQRMKQFFVHAPINK
jgi:Ca-activated chloride channel family protein